jgi:hypothetical protein
MEALQAQNQPMQPQEMQTPPDMGTANQAAPLPETGA